ncbi:MAG TPA: sigma-70 family RNA polymerase sigma factor [Bacteroidia bacterium]|jgi:RNA polymerase sigma factor (sigma-70 family)|nr:sigma-70 family RNA polymerase sigma factor [Bacteroidia bacterium]
MGLFIRGNSGKYTDAELILKYKEGGDSYFVGELFKRYSHLVYGLCLNYFKDKDECKDAVMRIFEKLLVELRKHEVDHFPGWLSFVSRNYCISELRKKKTEESRMAEVKIQQQGEEVLKEAMEMKEEEYARELRISELKQALAELNEGQRQCIELFYINEKSYREICDITTYSEKEVKSFIQNGKRNLKIRLAGMSHAIIP